MEPNAFQVPGWLPDPVAAVVHTQPMLPPAAGATFITRLPTPQ
jgi:hypothetical protein